MSVRKLEKIIITKIYFPLVRFKTYFSHVLKFNFNYKKTKNNYIGLINRIKTK